VSDESVRAREKAPSEEPRCAFCHDVFGDDTDPGSLRAECSKCRAPKGGLVVLGALGAALVGSLVFFGLRGGFTAKETPPDERRGPPCPKCGEPLERGGKGGETYWFCYRCDADSMAPEEPRN
jgi:hypothetical protein